MKRKHLTITTIAVLALTTIAFAQGFGDRPFGRGDGRRGAIMHERVAVVLGLSEDQVAKWKAIQTATQEKMRPLAAERQANQATLRAEMTSAQPNAQKVGELMIANRRIAEQMNGLREQSRALFESILTPEQKAKHDELKALRGDRPGRGGRRGMGRGFGPGPID
ncbi:MAG TPA: Spy/CpxP family protein refolding chaperone [Thermoanaerobaculia bacterium]